MPKPVMPPFEEISVSTKTVIAQTNATYDIQKLFDKLPVSSYIVVKKKRGRKKQFLTTDPNANLPSGSIITMKYFEHLKGVELKPKKSRGKYFRNALSIVMKVGDKLVNFKLSKNGKFQMTGIKTDFHAIECVKKLWQHILDLEDHTMYAIPGAQLNVILKVVMTNIDFSLGFLVNREHLDRFFNQSTRFNSLLETSFGYTGVNIKFPIQGPIYDHLRVFSLNLGTKIWGETKITFDEYLQSLSDSDRNKESKKKRFNTFLVFHSGNVIMSGAIKEKMKGPYLNFLEIIKECKPDIEEKLDI